MYGLSENITAWSRNQLTDVTTVMLNITGGLMLKYTWADSEHTIQWICIVVCNCKGEREIHIHTTIYITQSKDVWISVTGKVFHFWKWLIQSSISNSLND